MSETIVTFSKKWNLAIDELVDDYLVRVRNEIWLKRCEKVIEWERVYGIARVNKRAYREMDEKEIKNAKNSKINSEKAGAKVK